MAEILRRFAAVILASGCFISLASCGGNKVAENVSKTDTPMPTETSEVSSDVGEVPLQNLPDNSTQERIDWVINEGNGRVYNMFLDNDGTVRWIYDNVDNPRMTRQVNDFMDSGATLDELSDYLLELGISPNPYVATMENDENPAPSVNPEDLPDNATQERLDFVITTGDGTDYNMILAEDGTVHWMYDNEENPRMTQMIANFLAENNSMAGLFDYAYSLGINPSGYIAIHSGNGTNTASDPGYVGTDEPDTSNNQGNSRNADAWYSDTIAKMDASYANRDSHEQVVFSQQWDGSVVAEQRTSYDNMEVVPVEPCEEYTLTDNTWYWIAYTDDYGYQWVTWLWLVRHDDGYLHAYYNYITGVPMVTWGNQTVTTISVDDPDGRNTTKMANADYSAIAFISDNEFTFRGCAINSNKVRVDVNKTVTMDEIHACPQFNSKTTGTELYEYTVNEIIPNL